MRILFIQTVPVLAFPKLFQYWQFTGQMQATQDDLASRMAIKSQQSNEWKDKKRAGPKWDAIMRPDSSIYQGRAVMKYILVELCGPGQWRFAGRVCKLSWPMLTLPSTNLGAYHR
jgi:hypothetical protein